MAHSLSLASTLRGTAIVGKRSARAAPRLLARPQPDRIHLLIEHEVRRDRQLDPQEGPCDGLHAGTELYPGELVNKTVQRFPHPRQLHQLAQICWLEVVVPEIREGGGRGAMTSTECRHTQEPID